MRHLGIDHGQKRIGVAISDATGRIARPLTIVAHTSRTADANAIAELATQHAVDEIVIGLPTDADGEIGPRARTVQRFGAVLETLVNCSVKYWDESYSTREAWAVRHRAGMGRKKASQTPIDAEAAAIILQSYLDAEPPPE